MMFKKKKEKKEGPNLNRSVVIDLDIKDKVLKKIVIDSILLFRAICRAVFSIGAIAEIAGANILRKDGRITVIRRKEKAKKILAELFDMQGYKTQMYEMKNLVRVDLASSCVQSQN